MNAKTLVGSLVAASLLSVVLIGALVLKGPPKSAPAEVFAERLHALEPLWPAPPFAFVDQQGATVTLQSLAGRPWVANFVFTQCRTVCPLLTAKMVQVQRQLRGASLRFVSFSVDPAHDTPAVLDAYRRHWNADEPRWTLLATGEKTLPPLAAGFHVLADKAPAGEVDPIMHSGVFVLVDGAGLVRGIYDSEHREDFAALVRDARTLAQAEPLPDAPGPKSGEALYHELSCVACHERPELAPPLRGLAGRTRELEAAALVKADAAYVRAAILTPEAQRVAGYPLHMPSYDGLLEPAALETLVDWVMALPAPERPDAGEPGFELAIDPVCHMEVRVGPETPTASTDGGRWSFCSDVCRERFVANPAVFVSP